jgi:3-oxoacyl-[acyl-carrier protein] reductase
MSKEKPGIWITGASSGIGRAAAIEFAKTGAKVFISGRRAAELERINTEINSDKLSVEVFPCNVASHTNVDQTVKKISANSKIDCLINNAGITSFKLAEENSINEINDIINTNLLGSIYTIKAVLPQMVSKGGGTIINILSVVTKKTFTKSSIYTASKMGLLGYTNSLREEVRKHNIKVINVIPGATSTPIWSKEIRNQHSERMMTSEDIARVLVWAFLQKENLVTEELVLRPIEGDL